MRLTKLLEIAGNRAINRKTGNAISNLQDADLFYAAEVYALSRVWVKKSPVFD